jgi:hypothetical protein
MQEKARVLFIEKNIITVAALDVASCVGCANSHCRENGSEFTVSNKLQLDIHPGSVVRVVARVRNQLVQSLVSLGVPVLVAVVIWLLVSVLFPAAEEALLVGASLLGLIGAGALMFRITGNTANDLPEIVEII